MCYWAVDIFKMCMYTDEEYVVAELTGCSFDATAQIRNDSAMLHRATISLLQ
jgi:hypothetical protein